jgi:sugar O-acyltransferase (sialic acid O-acetyltransferase NeuD family)
MKSLLIIGGGGHCHSCIDIIETGKVYQITGIVQPKRSSELIFGYEVIGSDDDLPNLLKRSNSFLIAVGQIKDPDSRIRLFNTLKQLGAELPVIISPRAYCSERAVVGEGSIIMHGAVVNAGARIGNNCIVNSLALVEHGVKIGDHCHISTGTRVNGDVIIGNGSFVGSGAVIRESIRIGERVIIGAGNVVLEDVPDFTIMKNVK